MYFAQVYRKWWPYAAGSILLVYLGLFGLLRYLNFNIFDGNWELRWTYEYPFYPVRYLIASPPQISESRLVTSGTAVVRIEDYHYVGSMAFAVVAGAREERIVHLWTKDPKVVQLLKVMPISSCLEIKWHAVLVCGNRDSFWTYIDSARVISNSQDHHDAAEIAR